MAQNGIRTVKWFVRGLVLCLGMICLMTALLAVVWLKRLDIAHFYVSNFLTKQGYQGAFTIEILDLSQLVMRDVEIGQNDHSVLRAKRLNLQYSIASSGGGLASIFTVPDMGNITIERVEIDGLELDVHGGAGRNFPDFFTRFLPPTAPDNLDPNPYFPAQGIWVKNAVLSGRYSLDGTDLPPELGQYNHIDGRVEFDLTAHSQSRWDLGYQMSVALVPIDTSDLSGSSSGAISQPVFLSGGVRRNGAEKTSIFGEIKAPNLLISADDISAQNLSNFDQKSRQNSKSQPLWAVEALKIDYNFELDPIGPGRSLTVDDDRHDRKISKPKTVSGWVNMTAKSLNTPLVQTNNIAMKSEGNIDFWGDRIRLKILGEKTAKVENILSTVRLDWQGKADRFHLVGADSRAAISQGLTAGHILSKAPISRYFAPALTASLERVLSQTAVRGMGNFVWSDGGYEVALTAPFQLRGDRDTVVVEARDKPVILFDRAARNLEVTADIVLSTEGGRSHPRLQLSLVNLNGHSENGLSVSRLKSLTARVQTDADWYGAADAKPSDRVGQQSGLLVSEKAPIRLGPVDLSITVSGQMGGGKMGENTAPNFERKVSIRLLDELDYDGLLLGMVVSKLKVLGEMRVGIVGEQTKIEFAADQPVLVQSVKFPQGWTGRDLSFRIVPDQFLMVQTSRLVRDGETPPTKAVASLDFKADIAELSGFLKGPDGEQQLRAAVDNLSVNMRSNDGASIKNSGSNMEGLPVDLPRMNWDITAMNAQIWSDDFLAQGTHIQAKNAEISVVTARQAGGDLSLKFKFQSPNTVIETDNILTGEMRIEASGTPDQLQARYDTKRVRFKNGDIPVLPFGGELSWSDRRLEGRAHTFLPQSEDTPIDIIFHSKDGKAGAKVLIPIIHFTPSGLQPQTLIPSLRGKLADVRGDVSAEFDFEFGGGVPIQSRGVTRLIDLDVGTLVGPFSGVNSVLEFSSIFPLKTKGVQFAKIDRFDPGFPLERGEIKFEIIPNGVRIDQAVWPVISGEVAALGGAQYPGFPIPAPQHGEISISPLTWKFGDVENNAVINIEGIDLGVIFKKIGRDKFSISGLISGTLPARINGVQVTINKGQLAIKDGGVIQFKSGADQAAAAANEYAGHGLKALENLYYKSMELRIDGPLDGAVNLDMVFDGKNPDVLNGQAFLFDISVQGELANIARNLSRAFNTHDF